MSTAEAPLRRARAADAGYTLVEAIVVVFVTAVISIVLIGALAGTQQADRYLQAMRTAAERGQRITLEVASLVNGSRKIFQGDDAGKAYLAALSLAGNNIAAGARLPVIAEDEVMGEDGSEARTGNVLLFVREADPAPCVADGATKKIRHIDTYRFVCVYPHLTNSALMARQSTSRDLIIWRSQVYVSWAQINEITDPTEKKNVLKDLYKRFEYRYAWDPDSSIDAAFYAFDAVGNIDSTPKSTFTIDEDTSVSDRSRLVYARVQLARSDENHFSTRAVLSSDDPKVWKPDGFEVKVTGASRTRSVWIHIVVEAPEQGGQRSAIIPSTVIATCQDM